MKLLKYEKGGRIYVSGGIASMTPSGMKPIEEIDVDNKSKEEVEEILKDNKLFDKLKKKV